MILCTTTTNCKQAMDNFIKNLPKIELHAHLNGSLSDSTLNKLVDLRKRSQPDFTAPDLINFSNFRSLSECFDVFKLAHDLVDCAEAVQLAVENVIREFSEENCVYLELRSTPRATSKMTKEEYLNTVINTMISCQSKHPNTIVKFIPSINISYGVDEAKVNFELFTKMRERYPSIVVGIDLSGDPTKGKFADFKHIYERARCLGFGLALHCAETDDYGEILEMLEFMEGRDRIGHGTFIDESQPEIWKLFIEKKIPVECCLTSNVLCKSVACYEDHHIRRLLKVEHPLTICTDDCGVFKTSLTRELGICAATYKLTMKQLLHIVNDANRMSFASDSERAIVGEKLRLFELSLAENKNML